MRIHFYVRFSTKHGQYLSLLINTDLKGISDTVVMEYLNEEFWHTHIDIEDDFPSAISYKYLLTNPDGSQIMEWEKERNIPVSESIHEIAAIDTWNHAGDFENAFFTA